METTARRLTLLATLLFSLSFVKGQSPYHYGLKRELPLLLAGFTTSGAGHILQLQTQPLSRNQVIETQNRTLNGIDQFFFTDEKPGADIASDLTMYSGGLLAASLVLDKKVRDDFWGIVLMGGETVLLTDGITAMTKAIFLRPRPYVRLHDTLPGDWTLSRNSRFSFISGHTSFTSGVSFFAARVFHDLHPGSKWRIPVWAAAAILPGVTGWLRIRAARHYFTDVAAGYVVGAIVGIGIPWLHKKEIAERLTILPAENGYGLCLNFTF